MLELYKKTNGKFELIAILENAFNIEIRERSNQLSTISFDFPSQDDKNAQIKNSETYVKYDDSDFFEIVTKTDDDSLAGIEGEHWGRILQARPIERSFVQTGSLSEILAFISSASGENIAIECDYIIDELSINLEGMSALEAFYSILQVLPETAQIFINGKNIGGLIEISIKDSSELENLRFFKGFNLKNQISKTDSAELYNVIQLYGFGGVSVQVENLTSIEKYDRRKRIVSDSNIADTVNLTNLANKLLNFYSAPRVEKDFEVFLNA